MKQHLIEIENLRFSWPGAIAPLLACDSFSLARGEHLFVRGPSGSGKSTLLGLLTGILTPESGHLSLMQQDTAGLSATRRDRLRADHIGYIFQQFNLVPYLDLVENVILPCRFSHRRAENAERAHGSIAAAAEYLLRHLFTEGELDRNAPVANLSGTRCVLGTLVVWLEEVTVPEKLFEEERFASDARYAYHMANMNLLTYLIEHEDGRQGNFLVSEIESDRRVFSVDNGVSFGAKMKNFFVLNWHKIRVPALRRETIERLRRVTPEQIEALGVLTELRADDLGVLRPVPFSANAKPRKGARPEPGWIQLGLSSREIKKLRKRIERLLVQVDGGRQPVF